MVSSFVVALLTAAPAPAKLALPPPTAIGVDARYAAFCGEHLAQQLRSEGLGIVTSQEIAAVLGLERQKQLLGCADAVSTCMAELANAFGTDGVVLVDLARVGAKTQVNVKVLASRDGAVLASSSARVEGDEAVLDELSRAATVLTAELSRALGFSLTPARPRLGWLVPTVAGAAALTAGVVLYALGWGDYGALTQAMPGAPLSLGQAAALRDGGRTKQVVGLVAGAVGLLAVAGGFVWFAVSRAAPAVTLAPTRDGFVVALTGGLP